VASKHEMATTNGTPAFIAATTGLPVIVGAAVNFQAAAAMVAAYHEHSGVAILLCRPRAPVLAGRAYARAALPRWRWRETPLGGAHDVDWGARVVRHYGNDMEVRLDASAAARDLKRLGFTKDIATASQADTYDIVRYTPTIRSPSPGKDAMPLTPRQVQELARDSVLAGGVFVGSPLLPLDHHGAGGLWSDLVVDLFGSARHEGLGLGVGLPRSAGSR